MDANIVAVKDISLSPFHRLSPNEIRGETRKKRNGESVDDIHRSRPIGEVYIFVNFLSFAAFFAILEGL